jgi:hypothetical protein
MSATPALGAAVAAVPLTRTALLRSPSFDVALIAAAPLLALAAAGLIVANPDLFWPVFYANAWVLAYPHVLATYARIGVDAESARKFRALATWIPAAILVATLGLGAVGGLPAIFSVYFYWQWFHYTRQSYGIAQAYRRKSEATDPELVNKLAIYGIAAWGILRRVGQVRFDFLGLPIWHVALPDGVLTAAAVGAIVPALAWAGFRARDLAAGRRVGAHTAFMASHFVIFGTGYLLLEDVTLGWIVLNVWHNAQYLLFTWNFNNGRATAARAAGTPASRLVALTGAGSLRLWLFFAGCLIGAAALYGVLYALLPPSVLVIGLPAAIIVGQAINFHHYTADALVWRRPRPARA